MSYFSLSELQCKCGKCGGEVYFDDEFLDILNNIRADCGFPLPVSSGYRCFKHPIEAAKPAPGAHAQGRAVDLLVYGDKALRLFDAARRCGIKRIGVHQKGPTSGRYVHLDTSLTAPSPAFWTY